MIVGRVPYYKFVAYNSGFGNNKTAIFDEFILNQGFRDSEHKENININSIPFDDLLKLKEFLDKEENKGFYRTIRRAVNDELETEKRQQELHKFENQKKQNKYLINHREKQRHILESKITYIINDQNGNQKNKLLKKLKDTLRECKFNENVINSINFDVILEEYSTYVKSFLRNNANQKTNILQNHNMNIQILTVDEIEDKLIDIFYKKNRYGVCNMFTFKKIGIVGEIQSIKDFLIGRTKTHFYDDIDIKYNDIDFDEQALNILKKYGNLENYIDTLTSNSEEYSKENNNFNSKIFKQITQRARNIQKQRSIPVDPNTLRTQEKDRMNELLAMSNFSF